MRQTNAVWHHGAALAAHAQRARHMSQHGARQLTVSQGPALRTCSAILFGTAGSIPGVVVLLRLGTWEQVSDKGPFIVVTPGLVSALSGAAWGARVVAARTKRAATVLAGLAGLAAVVGWILAIAMYFGFGTTSRYGCESIRECITVGLVITAFAGGWAIPPLAALAGLALRKAWVSLRDA
jgi:hypothetical protein